MAVVKTRRQNAFPGDKAILVFVRDDAGREHGIMNIMLEVRRGNTGTHRWYESDRFGCQYDTVKQAKTHALEVYNAERRETERKINKYFPEA